jgi:hypothetical protein
MGSLMVISFKSEMADELLDAKVVPTNCHGKFVIPPAGMLRVLRVAAAVCWQRHTINIATPVFCGIAALVPTADLIWRNAIRQCGRNALPGNRRKPSFLAGAALNCRGLERKLHELSPFAASEGWPTRP